MWELRQKERLEGPDALTPAETLLAAAPDKIRVLFDRAKRRAAPGDAYSLRDEHEYFAQGMTALSNRREAARLERLDPDLFSFVQQIESAVQSYPPLAPVPQQRC